MGQYAEQSLNSVEHFVVMAMVDDEATAEQVRARVETAISRAKAMLDFAAPIEEKD